MLPDRLYEALPYLYLTIGILGWFAVLGESNVVGSSCSAVLIAAAIHIFNLRRKYRRSR